MKKEMLLLKFHVGIGMTKTISNKLTMIDIGYVALERAQSPALAATKPYSLANVPEIADHPYGAPKHTWVTKAGTNIDHRLAFPLLSTAASGAKRPPLPEIGFSVSFHK